MRFDCNVGKTPEFSERFNQMARKPFDVAVFYEIARDAGYAEARVRYPGNSLLMENSHQDDRINAHVDESGYLKRYVFG